MAADHKKAAAALPPRGNSSSYRDDPDALSMHTTRSDYDYDDVPQLPPYSDSIAVSPTADDGVPPVQTAYQEDQYQRVYAPVNRFTTSKDCSPTKAIGPETSFRLDEGLLDPEELHRYIECLSVVPPEPYVRIQGWHWESVKRDNKKETNKVYDFDVALNLGKYLRREPGPKPWWYAATVSGGEKVHRGTFRKIRAPGYKQDIEVGGEQKRDLMEWCTNFCEHKSALKIFRVSRQVTGLDEEYIDKQLVPLIRSTHYRGHVDITFPTADKNVDIYTPHWVNRARISWVRWLFYLTFLWIFTWPILFFLTKRWDVYRVHWVWARRVRNDERQRFDRQYASISEKEWVDTHKNLIVSLVLDKFHGDATSMAVDVDVATAMARRSGDVPLSGNANVDAAVNLFRGGLSAWNAVNGRENRFGGGWGMDS